MNSPVANVLRTALALAAMTVLSVAPSASAQSLPRPTAPVVSVNMMPAGPAPELELGSAISIQAFSPKVYVAWLWSQGVRTPPSATLGLLYGLGSAAELQQTDTVTLATIAVAGVPYTDIQFQSGTSAVYSIRAVANQEITLHALNGAHFGGPGSSTTFLLSGLTNATDLHVVVRASDSYQAK